MVSQQKIYALHVFAGAHWIAGTAFVFVDLFSGVETGELGLLMAMVGAVANAKMWLSQMEERLSDRERSAFELGRDSVRLLQ